MKTINLKNQDTLKNENSLYENLEKINPQFSKRMINGKSAKMESFLWPWLSNSYFKSFVNDINRIVSNDIDALIIGETGTGKELIANSIFTCRNKKLKLNKLNLITINSAILNNDLVDSELFGHERGAFTGAIKPYKGIFERADNGVLFFDDIQCLSLSTQAKLLRIIQEKEFYKVGGTQKIKVNCSLIFASNIPLEVLVANNKFRKDLYYRLTISPINLPPLREFKSSLPIIIKVLLYKIRKSKFNCFAESVSSEAFEALLNYNWPGNIRELEHALIYGSIRSGKVISRKDLPNNISTIN